MPDYKGKPCQGSCERINRDCIRPEIFTEVAERFGAEPLEKTGSMKIDGRNAPWSYYALNVQDDKREEIVTGITAVMKLRDAEIEWVDNELERLVNNHFIEDFPCHLECGVAICGYCGFQHERYMIHDKTCDVKEAINRRMPVKDEEE